MTDRRTDGRTDGRTEFSSLDRVCISCSAVKMKIATTVNAADNGVLVIVHHSEIQSNMITGLQIVYILSPDPHAPQHSSSRQRCGRFPGDRVISSLAPDRKRVFVGVRRCTFRCTFGRRCHLATCCLFRGLSAFADGNVVVKSVQSAILIKLFIFYHLYIYYTGTTKEPTMPSCSCREERNQLGVEPLQQ